jgi:hypothetical protein
MWSKGFALWLSESGCAHKTKKEKTCTRSHVDLHVVAHKRASVYTRYSGYTADDLTHVSSYKRAHSTPSSGRSHAMPGRHSQFLFPFHFWDIRCFRSTLLNLNDLRTWTIGLSTVLWTRMTMDLHSIAFVDGHSHSTVHTTITDVIVRAVGSVCPRL